MRLAVPMVACCLGIALPVRAEEPASAEEQLFELNDALTRETTVASTHGLSIRETPGVVTVVTHEEIVASGAADLLGVLMLVPGFSPAVDVEGVVDLGLRGIWGHEGKILLLVDGIEMNELLYSSNQLGMHYPVDQLDEVEIIRGPGSVRYGGYAELAVINLKTRTAKQLSGAEASVRMGAREHGLGTRTVSLAGGAATDRFGGASISIAGFLGEGSRSERDYIDPRGQVAHLAFQSGLRPAFLNVGAELHGVLLRIIHDGYQLDEQDSYGNLLGHPAALGFTADAVDLTYHWKATPRLTVTPRLTWRRQTPWQLLDSSVGDYYSKTVQRWSGGVTAAYDLLDTLTLTGGLEGYADRAWLNDTTLQGSQTQFGGYNEVSYRNAAALVEAQYASFIGNLIGGLRYEHHSKFGDSLVPRLALTKVLGAFHFKLLASRAFRAPAIENINAGVDVKPETTTGLETEVGYQLSDNLYVSANGFNTVVSDPIVYAVDPATPIQSYRNFSQTGSRGVELEGRASRSG
jgi:outer membrane receptor for ferrienterochelin and colicin